MKKIIQFMTLLVGLSAILTAGGHVKPVSSPIFLLEEEEHFGFYMGGGAGVDRVNSFLFGPDIAYSLMVRMGYDFNPYFGVELRGTYAIKDGPQLGHDYSYGLYLKPQYPVSESFTLYGLLGYAHTKIAFDKEPDFNGITNNYTIQNGFSFGAGIEYHLNDNWSMTIDAVRYIDKVAENGVVKYASKVDNATLGILYRF